MKIESPEVGTTWRHYNGNEYEIVAIANEHTTYPEKYPVSVVHIGGNGRVWTRPLSDWHRSHTEVSK